MAKNSIIDIAAIVARKQKISKKEASDIVSAFFRTIAEGLHEDRLVKVRGLGAFKVTAVKPRESVNVNTGERVVIEGHDKISFVPDTAMKEFVNKPFAQFTTVPVNEGVNFDSIDAASDAEERKMGIGSDADNDSETDEQSYNEPNELLNADDISDSEDEQYEGLSVSDNGNDEIEPGSEESSSSVGQILDSVVISSEPDASGTAQERVTTAEEKVVPSTSSNGTEQIKAETDHQSTLPANSEIKCNEQKTADGDTSVSLSAERHDSAEHNNAGVPETDENIVSREYFDEQMRLCRHRCNRNLILGFVLLIVGLIAGFFVGGLTMPMINPEKPIAKAVPVKTVKPSTQPTVKPDSTVRDSIPKADTIVKPDNSSDEQEKIKKEEEEDAPEVKAPDEDLPADIAKLNADRRLRFGAYEITGVDRVVRLKKGQTMQSFSNKTLGKDMVVYFQVLNGVSDLKPGDKMKVPKIRLKKQFRKP